jgi:hypothetical protein
LAIAVLTSSFLTVTSDAFAVGTVVARRDRGVVTRNALQVLLEKDPWRSSRAARSGA